MNKKNWLLRILQLLKLRWLITTTADSFLQVVFVVIVARINQLCDNELRKEAIGFAWFVFLLLVVEHVKRNCCVQLTSCKNLNHRFFVFLKVIFICSFLLSSLHNFFFFSFLLSFEAIFHRWLTFFVIASKFKEQIEKRNEKKCDERRRISEKGNWFFGFTSLHIKLKHTIWSIKWIESNSFSFQVIITNAPSIKLCTNWMDQNEWRNFKWLFCKFFAYFFFLANQRGNHKSNEVLSFWISVPVNKCSFRLLFFSSFF